MSNLGSKLASLSVSENVEAARSILDELDALGSTFDFSGPRAAIANADRVSAASMGQVPHYEELQSLLSERVLDNTVSLDDALDQITEAHRLNARGSVGTEFLAAVAETATKRAWWSFSAYKGKLIPDVLAPLHDRIIASLRSSGRQVAAVRSANEAIRLGLVDEWRDSVDAFDQWNRVHKVAEALRFAKFDTSHTSRYRSGDYEPLAFRFRESKSANAVRRRDFAEPFQWLFQVLDYEPAVLTIAEARANQARDESRAHAQRAGNAPVVSRQSSYLSDDQIDSIVAEVESRH